MRVCLFVFKLILYINLLLFRSPLSLKICHQNISRVTLLLGGVKVHPSLTLLRYSLQGCSSVLGSSYTPPATSGEWALSSRSTRGTADVQGLQLCRRGALVARG